MRFDLEIANTNVDLMYIPEGVKIPQGAISTYYVGIDSRKAIPSDFISIEENVLNNPFAGQGSIEVAGPSFYANSDQFLITNIAKYITYENVRIPLFFRHVIDHSVPEDGIKVTDYDGGSISTDDYLVEQTDKLTYVYMNKSDKILFIEYVSEKRVFRRLLNLQPIFTAMTWDDISLEGIPNYKYTATTEGRVDTSYPGTLYVLYQNEVGLIRKPICNIDDPWYLSVLNTSFTVTDKFTKRLYHVPEFYIQHSFSTQQFKKLTHNKCKMLYSKYISLQAPPALEKIKEVVLYVEDYYTGQLKYIFSTDPNKQGILFEGNIHYGVTEDYNNTGVIALPIEMTDSDIVYADYYIYDDFYEFRLVDFSTSLLTHGGYITFYIIPDANDGEAAVFCAYIGQDDKREWVEKIGTQGVGFWSMDDYQAYLAHYKCYHLCTIAISASGQSDLITMYDARRLGGTIANRKAVSEISSDIFYDDLISGRLTIPVRDTLIALLDTERLDVERTTTINRGDLTLSGNTMTTLDYIQNVIQKSLDISTSAIMQIRLDNQIPPSKMIGIVNGYISTMSLISSEENTGIGG